MTLIGQGFLHPKNEVLTMKKNEPINAQNEMQQETQHETNDNFDPLSPDNIDSHVHTKARDHELKINPLHFKDVLRGAKKSELRRGNKDDYQVGDFLTLREYVAVPVSPHAKMGYTGRTLICQITHVLLINSVHVELRGKPDFVVLSIDVITAR